MIFDVLDNDFTFPSYLRSCNLDVIAMSMNTDHDMHVDVRYTIIII